MKSKNSDTRLDSILSRHIGPLLSLRVAPLTFAHRALFQLDAKDVRAAAQRKVVPCDDWDAKRGTASAKQYFQLGCWLFYYSRRVSLFGTPGLVSRIDCARLASPEAVSYLHSRGIGCNAASRFCLGFASSSSSNLSAFVEGFYTAAVRASSPVVSSAGVPPSIFYRFRNRLMFPIRDRTSAVLGFGGPCFIRPTQQ